MQRQAGGRDAVVASRTNQKVLLVCRPDTEFLVLYSDSATYILRGTQVTVDLIHLPSNIAGAPTWVSSLRSRLLLRSPALTVRKMALPLGALFAWKVLSLMSPCSGHHPQLLAATSLSAETRLQRPHASPSTLDPADATSCRACLVPGQQCGCTLLPLQRGPPAPPATPPLCTALCLICCVTVVAKAPLSCA